MSLLLTALTLGITLGASAGLAPGPMTALVLRESLHGGLKNGAKIAIAPLLTDFPVLLLAIWLTSSLGTGPTAMAALTLGGAAMMLFLAWEGWRTSGFPHAREQPQKKYVFLRGLLTSVLSPNPILFWMTIGMETIHVRLKSDWLWSSLFISSFYITLLMSKLLIAWTGGHSHSWLSPPRLIFVNRLLASALLLLGVTTLWRGLRLLSWPLF